MNSPIRIASPSASQPELAAARPLAVVFGATGQTGAHLLSHALEAGYRVRAVARDVSRVQTDNVEAVSATLDDERAMRDAIRGADIVFCAIGAPPSSKDMVRSRATAAIIAAMRAENVQRLVALSSHGVGQERLELPWFFRFVVLPFFLERVFADHDTQEKLLLTSGLDYTIVKPPHLKNGKSFGPLMHGPSDTSPIANGRMKITRDDVAGFMVQVAQENQYLRSAVSVSS